MRKFLFFMVIFLFITNIIFADEVQVEQADNDFGLESLMDMTITTLARKPQSVLKSSAAVFVLTNEDIRRSGARSIPEALRYVPGLNVAKISGNSWSISSRGFAGKYANKLLVMIDGRSIYTPVFAGVYWEHESVMLQDVDRIEIIRGPGSSLWGANAVNGIINVITKKAQDTQGGLIYAGVGTYDKEFGGIRYGDQIGGSSYYRGYLKYFNNDEMEPYQGFQTDDNHKSWQLGTRIDTSPTPDDDIILDFKMYQSQSNNIRRIESFRLNWDTFPVTVKPEFFHKYEKEERKTKGLHLLSKWEHEISDTSSFTLQGYYDYKKFENFDYISEFNTFDLDFQHNFEIMENYNLIWGLGYRKLFYDLEGGKYISFKDSDGSLDLLSCFIQNEITLIEDLLTFTIGTKIERNDYTGFEFQPSARFTLTPTEHSAFWLSAARAVRTPSVVERGGGLLASEANANPEAGLPAPPHLTWNTTNEYKSEDAMVYEMGYRHQLSDALYVDLALFYNEYNNQRTTNMDSPTSTKIYCGNDMDVTTYGLELSSKYKIYDWWQLQAGYSYLYMSAKFQDKNFYFAAEETPETETPTNQAFLQSFMDLPYDFELDLGLRYVSEVEGRRNDAKTYTWNIPAYIAMDARIAWKPTENMTISLVGKNLLDSSHPEYRSTYLSIQSTETPRSFFLMMEYTF